MEDSIFVVGKVQQAIRDYLRDVNTTVIKNDEILAGLSPGNINSETGTPTPNIIVECSNGQWIAVGTACWMCPVTVKVRSHAHDSTEWDHIDLAGQIFTYFSTDQIAKEVSEHARNFTAFSVIMKNQGYGLRGHLWESYIDLEVYCVGLDIEDKSDLTQ